jgi:hypothetical protein
VDRLVIARLGHRLARVDGLPDMVESIVERVCLVRLSVKTNSGPISNVELDDTVAIAVGDNVSDLAVILGLPSDDLQEALSAVQDVKDFLTRIGEDTDRTNRVLDGRSRLRRAGGGKYCELRRRRRLQILLGALIGYERKVDL